MNLTRLKMESEMNKLLIINFKRYGDIYSSAHLISAIKAKHPDKEISLLIFEEFKNAASNINHIKNIFTIDRKKISSILKNKIYSNAYALIEFKAILEKLEKESFNEIFNYSNDLMSTNISSYLKSDKKIKTYGTTINNDKTIHCSNDYALLFNDVLTEINNSPIHFQDCYANIASVDHTHNENTIITLTKNDEEAEKTINLLRSSHHERKIIAIQVKTSSKSKDIPYLTLRNLIALVKENKDYTPLLLIAPIKEEKDFANKLNKEFCGSLVIVEADLCAAASILKNCDLLITPDTVIKHIADHLDIRVLEVSLGPSPFLKQGPFNAGNLVLTDIINERHFNNKDFKSSNFFSRITAEHIFSATEYLLSQKDLLLNSSVSLYQSVKDEFGVRYKIIGGEIPWQQEIDRLIMREWISQKTKNLSLKSIYKEIENIPLKEKNIWVARNKNTVSHIMKDLLATLRTLANIKNGSKNSLFFIESLDKLLLSCIPSEAVSIPLFMFRSKIENIRQNDIDSSVIKFESLLFNLKTDLILYLDLITKTEANPVKTTPSTSDLRLTHFTGREKIL